MVPVRDHFLRRYLDGVGDVILDGLSFIRNRRIEFHCRMAFFIFFWNIVVGLLAPLLSPQRSLSVQIC